MSSKKTIVTISIDGSAIGNGTPNAKAGYGMVIQLNDSIAEYNAPLCPTCDHGLQTNNRAELRAAESALNFLHELAKTGHHKHCQLVPSPTSTISQEQDYNYISDHRTIKASQMIGIIRTDSTFVEKGATKVNRQIRHKDIWNSINNTKKCLTRAKMLIRFEHVQAHAGDWGNQRADDLAGEMARVDFDCEKKVLPGQARCVTCDQQLGSLADLAVHYKKIHLGRNVLAESFIDAMFNGEATGNYECTMCERQFRSGFAMGQHLRDKHGYSVQETKS